MTCIFTSIFFKLACSYAINVVLALLYNNVNQLYVYSYIICLSDLPPTLLHSIPSRSSQSMKPSFLRSTAAFFNSCSCIHSSVSTLILISQFCLFSPSRFCAHICSLHLHLYSCLENSFICTIFQTLHICVNTWYLFFSFWLTYLHTNSSSIHVLPTNDLLSEPSHHVQWEKAQVVLGKQWRETRDPIP